MSRTHQLSAERVHHAWDTGLPPLPAIEPLPEAQADAAPKKEETGGRFDPYSQYEFVSLPDAKSALPDVDLPYIDIPPANLTAPNGGAGKDSARVFFGADPLAPDREAIAPEVLSALVLGATGRHDAPELQLDAAHPRTFLHAVPAPTEEPPAYIPLTFSDEQLAQIWIADETAPGGRRRATQRDVEELNADKKAQMIAEWRASKVPTLR